MENRIVNTKELALLFDGRNAQFGNVIKDQKLFLTLSKTGGFRYTDELFNKGIKTRYSQVITLDALYSKSMPKELRDKLRSTLGALEDTTLLCVYEKGEMELKDLMKVEIFLTKSLRARNEESEAKKMFEETIMPILEGEDERF